MTMPRHGPFYGWRVVGAAFVLAAFGWGIGFYGPPVFLSVVQRDARLAAWRSSPRPSPPISWSARSPAPTCRGSIGRFGAAGGHARSPPWRWPPASRLGCRARRLAAVRCGCPQRRRLERHERGGPQRHRLALVRRARRPAALAMAYNGGSVGGIIFSPLWVAAIAALGFPAPRPDRRRHGRHHLGPGRPLFSKTPQQHGPDAGRRCARRAVRPHVTSPDATAAAGTAAVARPPFPDTCRPAWPSACSRRSAWSRICSRCWCRRSGPSRRVWPCPSSPSWPSPGARCSGG